MKPQRFYKEVLFEALKITLASVSLLIEEGKKNNANINKTNLVTHTNYYASIALKSFHEFMFLNKDFDKKEFAIKKFTLIYGENFRKAMEDSSDLPNYFTFLDAFKILDDDCKVILYSILSLSSFYRNNSINKIKNILNTYIPRIKRLIKNADKYYKYFDFEIYSPFATKVILLNVLMECG